MNEVIARRDLAAGSHSLYVSFERTQSTPDWTALKAYLESSGPRPLLLRRRPRSEGTTVELELQGVPVRTIFFFSPKPADEQAEVAGILAALRDLHFDVEVSA